jgi:hypothetical protein
MVAMFEEQTEWCSHLEISSSNVCNLVLGPADGQVRLITHLEEATRLLRVM